MSGTLSKDHVFSDEICTNLEMLLGVWSNFCPKNENCRHNSHFLFFKFKAKKIITFILRKFYQTPESISQVSNISKETWPLVGILHLQTFLKYSQGHWVEIRRRSAYPMFIFLREPWKIEESFIFSLEKSLEFLWQKRNSASSL